MEIKATTDHHCGENVAEYVLKVIYIAMISSYFEHPIHSNFNPWNLFKK